MMLLACNRCEDGPQEQRCINPLCGHGYCYRCTSRGVCPDCGSGLTPTNISKEAGSSHDRGDYVQLDDGKWVTRDAAEGLFRKAAEHREEWEAEQQRERERETEERRETAEQAERKQQTRLEREAATGRLRQIVDAQLGLLDEDVVLSHDSVVADRRRDRHPLSEKFLEMAAEHGDQRHALSTVLRRVVELIDEWWEAECVDARSAYMRMSPKEKLEFQLWLLEEDR